MERISDSIVIIGAGWAGIATAEALLSKGINPKRIVLLERTPYPGGRAFSFVDRETGLALDNGQHVLLGCCDRFIALLKRLDVRSGYRLQPLLDIPVYHDGQMSRIASKRLVGPLHLLPALLAYRHLSPSERASTLAGALAFMRPRAEKLDAVSFAKWLQSTGQSDTAIRLVWDLVGTAILNGHAGEISAGLAAHSFHIGFMRGWQPARLGLFTRPLGDLARDAIDRLVARGVTIRYSTYVERVQVAKNKVCGLSLRDGSFVATEQVVSTVPHDALLRVLPDEWAGKEPFHGIAKLRWSPILNVFLNYDRQVLAEDVFAATDFDGMFVFNRGRLLPDSGQDGRWLSVSISAADRFRDWTHQEIIRGVQEAIGKACKDARDAKLLAAKVVWQPKATFLAEPGTWHLRPQTVTPITGLFLAGDWTRTDWPACLEGAVRSGETAALALLRSRQAFLV
ncbi:phytoene dehydrogenase [Alicyclobacillus hesperidum]|uniref:Phytoene dehydrogenase n=1 Tax=Alicyclobacillus hesperidum TaxID=89784 RepID=A0A1H2R1W8_9BACL|nr:hydroxysqualene dehydroxylase HpnE [Alicyclobacillus hesperidum]GLV13216.1 phytoene dehydrogenase [Alicyclobacillus hesperidum]SDW13371.1 squalene-associated FAD-dependent desaturase [Alicyclobacillus hesperidum]